MLDAGCERRLKMKKVAMCIVCSVGLLLAGCGLTLNQKVAIKNFCTATVEFSDLTAQEFSRTRSEIVEMNQFRKRLGDDPVLGVEGSFTVENVRARIDAVIALKKYGQLLNVLATTTQKEELKIAADSFVTSLRKVEGVVLTNDKAAAIGRAVQLVGGLIVEQQRLSAVKTVTEESHQSVIQVIDLVVRSLDPSDLYWSAEYEKTVLALHSAADIRKKWPLINDPNSNDPNNLASQVIIQEAHNVADAKKGRFERISSSIIDACDKLRNAERDLINVMKYKDFSLKEIDNYVDTIEEFIKLYKILNND